MSFFSTAEIAFGLDISDQSLRLVQMAKSGKKIRIHAYNEVNIPSGCLVNGEIKDPVIFAQTLNKLMKTKYGRGELSREAIIALPETETFLKSLEIEANNAEELPEKIRAMLPQSLPLDLEELYWDWQIAKKNRDGFEVVIGASPKKIVDGYLKIFNETGIIPVVLEVEASAIARLLIELNKETEPQIIIDIGHSRTGLFLYDGTIKFTVSLPISGRQINETIAQSLDFSAKQAEEAKIACGLDENKCQGAILELLAPTIEDLAKQILNAVNFYYENFPAPQEIRKIVLCGGGANTMNICQVLEQATDIKTEKSNAFKILENTDPTFFTPEKSQAFVTTIGLGLRGIYPEIFYDHS